MARPTSLSIREPVRFTTGAMKGRTILPRQYSASQRDSQSSIQDGSRTTGCCCTIAADAAEQRWRLAAPPGCLIRGYQEGRAVGALAAGRSPRRSVAARHSACSLRCPTRHCLPLVQLPAQPCGCPIRIRWPRRKSQHSRASRGTGCRRNSERLPSPARKRCHRTQATRFRLRPAPRGLRPLTHRVSRIRERTPLLGACRSLNGAAESWCGWSPAARLPVRVCSGINAALGIVRPPPAQDPRTHVRVA